MTRVRASPRAIGTRHPAILRRGTEPNHKNSGVREGGLVG